MASTNRDSLGNTFLIAVALCLVCSVVVSSLAVMLKPIQQENKILDQKKNILRAAGMLAADSVVGPEGESVDELFSEFVVRAVNLDTGEYVDDAVDVASYDPIKAAGSPSQSVSLGTEEDIATLRRRENISLVYLKTGPTGLEKLVIPVRGYGLWGTLYGYLALDSDLNTITGLGFYNHKETPGLGGEVDNGNWKAAWRGVRLFDENGKPAVRLVKQRSPASSVAASYEVDALSGATFTTRGVQNLVNFWAGEGGFGPYIERLKINGLARG